MLLASVLGVFIAMFFVWIISIGMLVGVLSGLGGSRQAFTLTDNTVLQIDLNGTLSDRESSDYFSGLLGGSNNSIILDDLLKAIGTAQENDKIRGIYLKNASLSSGIASLEPVRRALADFKGSGKFIVAYGDYYTQECYYLSSVADRVVMNPNGMFDLHGLAANIQFEKGFYDKLGVKYQVFKVGTFKSAVEPYIETGMSEPNRQQVTSYISSIWSYLLAGLSASRNLSTDELNRYADEYMAYSAPEKSVEYGLVDTLMYERDMEGYLKKIARVDTGADLTYVSASDLNSVSEKIKGKKPEEKIAVLYAEGTITTEESKGFYSLMGGVITDREYVALFNKLKDDANVKAVVFRVNSGGGSAFASEQIWNALVELKKEKPVIVSMGDYAASGGYYISCAADRIVAEPTTLTGSIGIFGIVREGEEMHKKLGLTFDGVSTNRHSSMFASSNVPLLGSAIRPFDSDERRIIQAHVERGYDLFVTRCADGRSKTKANIDSIGQGRVWTGAQALELGLVDELGGLDVAVKIAATHAQLPDYDVVTYPEKKDAFALLMESLAKGGIKAHLVKNFLGEEMYRHYMVDRGQPAPADFLMALMATELEP